MRNSEHNENENVRKPDPVFYLDEREGITFTLEELVDMAFPEEDFIVHPLLVRGAVCGLIGKPGDGKTMWTRQLAVSIAQGKKMVHLLPLNVREGKVLFLTKEDSARKTMEYFKIQGEAMSLENRPGDWIKNITCCFPDGRTNPEVISLINSIVSDNPVDLIVIDSFSAFFGEKDINNTISMRKILEPFREIATRTGCCILFIHHIRKAGHDATPDQVHAQGAGGFSQVVRALLDIRRDPFDASKRYLTVVKGNYVPDEFLKDSLVLHWNSETCLFEHSGEKIPRENIPVVGKTSRLLEIDWDDIFQGAEELERKVIAKRLMDEYEISRATVDRYLKYLKKVRQGVYARPE